MSCNLSLIFGQNPWHWLWSSLPTMTKRGVVGVMDKWRWWVILSCSMLCELPESTSTVRGKFPINPWNLSVWGEGDPVKAYGDDISASTSIFQKLMLCFTLKVKLSFHSNFDAQTSLFVAKPLWLSFHPKPLRPNHLLISPLVAVVITIVFILVVPVLVIVASQFCHSSASQFRPNLLEPSPLVDTPIGFRFKDSLRG